MLLEKINSMGTTVVVVTHAREIVDQFAKRVVAIDGGMVVSDKTGGYYQRPDLTRLTEEAAQQAVSSARRRKVIAQQLGVTEEGRPEEAQEAPEAPAAEAAPAVEEPRPEEQPHHTEVFNLDELLGLTGSQTSDEEVRA